MKRKMSLPEGMKQERLHVKELEMTRIHDGNLHINALERTCICSHMAVSMFVIC